jgi:hypothetical protein
MLQLSTNRFVYVQLRPIARFTAEILCLKKIINFTVRRRRIDKFWPLTFTAIVEQISIGDPHKFMVFDSR